MTDRDDSPEQSGQHFGSHPYNARQHDVTSGDSGGSPSIPSPADARGTGVPDGSDPNDSDSDPNDSEASNLVPRTERPAATDDGSAGSLYAGTSSRADREGEAGRSWQDSGRADSSWRAGEEANSSGQPDSSGQPVSNAPTSDYPATQHFHTPADQDPTQAISQQRAAPQQHSGRPYSPPQPAAEQAYGAVSNPYPPAQDTNGQEGRAGGQPSYPDNSAAAPDYASTQSGFFSPDGAQQPVRVEVKPASLRFGHNLAGGLLGVVLAAGAAALYVLVTKNHPATEAQSTGLKLALIGLAILLAIPGLAAGWAPAAAWFPGLILAVVGTAAVLSGWVDDKIASLSNTLFSSPALAQFAVSWALVGGWVLLLAGIGAQMARRSATVAAMDRIVQN